MVQNFDRTINVDELLFFLISTAAFCMYVSKGIIQFSTVKISALLYKYYLKLSNISHTQILANFYDC